MFDLNTSVKSYIGVVKASGCSADTVENYTNLLRLFSEWAKENGISEFTPAVISDYKVCLASRGLKQSTIRAYLRAVHLFFSYCEETKMIAENPCTATVIKTKVPPPKSYKHLLSREEIVALLSPSCPKGATKSVWPRTYCMTVLYLTSACRNTELRSLAMDDLDFSSGTIHIRSGKGDKERWCAFPPVAQSAVKAYLFSGLRPKDCKPSDLLFGKGNCRSEWREFGRSEISTLIERYVRLVTGKSDIRTHALRHSSASILLDAGMSTDDISDILGHSSVAVTARYIDRLKPEKPAECASFIFSALSEAV